MRIKAALPLMIVAIGGIASSARSAGLPVFQPAGQWTANSDDGRCTLARDLTGGGATVTLTIEPLPLSKDVDLVLKSAGAAGRYARFGSRVGFSPDGPPVERDTLAFDTADGAHHVLRLRVLRTDLDRAAASGSIIIRSGDRFDAALSLPKLGAGLRALDQCERAIIGNVGLSPAQVAAIATSPEPPRMLFRWSDGYYKAADKGDPEDEAIVRYLVAADGKAVRCDFVHKARDPALNNGSCSYMTAPQSFSPALDRDGKAVAGLYFERIRWHRKSDYVPAVRY